MRFRPDPLLIRGVFHSRRFSRIWFSANDQQAGNALSRPTHLVLFCCKEPLSAKEGRNSEHDAGDGASIPSWLVPVGVSQIRDATEYGQVG